MTGFGQVLFWIDGLESNNLSRSCLVRSSIETPVFVNLKGDVSTLENISLPMLIYPSSIYFYKKLN